MTVFKCQPVSAQTPTRPPRHRRLLERLRRGTVLSLSLVLAFQPMLTSLAEAQVILDPNGNIGMSPKVSVQNKVPVVDITRPNKGGVSVTRFDQYNVDEHGLVLNNATSSVSTQLAGQVAANPNLTGGAAQVIVNEVTGTRETYMFGATEVAGAKADVIVANPNGVTCDGCDFINIRDVTLTSGSPIVNGSEITLDVTRGKVTVARGGLDGAGSGIGTTRLIGRAVVVDGELTAIDKVKISGGAQRYYMAADSASGQAGTGAVPVYAVDATAYGAMRAGQIEIVGTEGNLGVRALGDLQTSSGDLRIGAKGDIAVASGQSAGNVRITASGRITQSHDIAANGGTLEYEAKTIEGGIDSGLFARDGIELKAAEALSWNGEAQTYADVNIDSKGTVALGGYTRADGQVVVDAASDLLIDGATILAANVKMTSGGLADLNAGYVELTDDAGTVKVTGRDLRLASKIVFEDPTAVTLRAVEDFYNAADLRLFEGVDLSWGRNLINTEDGVIVWDDMVFDTPFDITNAGVMIGTNSVDITAGNFTNLETGQIGGSGTGRFTLATSFTNSGLVSFAGDLDIAGGSIANAGHVQGADVQISGSGIVNTATGLILAEGDLSVDAAGNLAQQGELSADGTIALQAGGAIGHGGDSFAGSDLSLSADLIAIGGTLASGADIALSAGQIASGAAAQVLAGLDIEAGSGIADPGAAISVTTGAASLGGIWVAPAEFTLLSTGLADISGGIAAGRASITAGDLDLPGQVLSSGAASLRVFGDAAISGMLTANAAGDLKIGGALSVIGLISAGTGLSIAANDIASGEAAQIQGRTLDIAAANRFDHAGAALAVGSATITAAAADIDGAVQAGEKLTVTAGSLSTGADGVLAGRAIALSSLGALSNAGTLIAEGELAAIAGAGLSNSGAVQGNQVLLAGASLSNAGTAIGTNGLTLSSGSTLSNAGTAYSEGDLLVKAKDRIEATGRMIAGGLMTLAATQVIAGPDASLVADNLVLGSTAAPATIAGLSDPYTPVPVSEFVQDGQLMLAGDLDLTGLDRLRLDGTVLAGGNVALDARELTSGSNARILAGATVDDTGAVTMAAGSNIQATGELLDIGGQWQASNLIDMEALGALTLGGLVIADRINLEALTLSMTAQSGAMAETSLNLNARQAINIAGTAISKSEMLADAPEIILAGEGVLSAASLRIGSAANVDTKRLDIAGTVQTTGAFDLTDLDSVTVSGQVLSEGDIGINAGQIVTETGAQIFAGLDFAALQAGNTAFLPGTTLTMNGTDLSLAGWQQAGGDVSLSATNQLDLSGSAVSDGAMNLSARAIVQSGLSQARTLSYRADDTLVLDGTISAWRPVFETMDSADFSAEDGLVDIAGGAIRIGATGAVGATSDLVVAADRFDNAGVLSAGRLISGQANRFTSAGSITAPLVSLAATGTDALLSLSGEVSDSGLGGVSLYSDADMWLGAEVSGRVITASASDLTLGSPAILRGEVINLTADDNLINSGNVGAIDLAGYQAADAAGAPLPGPVLSVNADRIENHGTLWSEYLTQIGQLGTDGTQQIVNGTAGTIKGQIVSVAADQGLNNAGKIIASATTDIMVRLGDIANTGLIHGAETQLAAGGKIASVARTDDLGIAGKNDLVVVADDLELLNGSGAKTNMLGGLGSKYIELREGGLELAAGESLRANTDLTLILGEDLLNQGTISGGSSLYIQTDGDILNHGGRLISGAGSSGRIGMTLIAGNSVGDTLKGQIHNDSGVIQTDGELLIRSRSFRNGPDWANDFENWIWAAGTRHDSEDVYDAIAALYGTSELENWWSIIEADSPETWPPHLVEGARALYGVDVPIYYDSSLGTVNAGNVGSFLEGDARLAQAVAGATTFIPVAGNGDVKDIPYTVLALTDLTRHWQWGRKLDLSAYTPAVTVAGGDINLLVNGIANIDSTISAGGDIYSTAEYITNSDAYVEESRVWYYDYLSQGRLSHAYFSDIPYYWSSGRTATIEAAGDIYFAGKPATGTGDSVTYDGASSIFNRGVISGNDVTLYADRISLGSKTDKVAELLSENRELSLGNYLNPPDTNGKDATLHGNTGSGSLIQAIMNGTPDKFGGVNLAWKAGSEVSGGAVPKHGTGLSIDGKYSSFTNPFGLFASNRGTGALVERTIKAATGTLGGAQGFTRTDLFQTVPYSGNAKTFRYDSSTEAKAVAAAVKAQTGSAYANDAWRTDQDQYAALLKNAREFASLHPGAEVGQPLTQKQIDALDAPVVWYVEEIVNGRKQLVPTLYMTGSEAARAPQNGVSASGNLSITGGKTQIANTALSGKNVSLTGSRINKGSVQIDAQQALSVSLSNQNLKLSDWKHSGATDLSLQTAGDILLNRKLNLAGDFTAIAGGNITGKAVDISANNISWMAGGSIALSSVVKEVPPITKKYWWRKASQRDTQTVDRIEVNGRQSLTMVANGNILLEGAALTSNGPVLLQAGGSIIDAAVQTYRKKEDKHGNYQYEREWVKNYVTQITSGADLTLAAGYASDRNGGLKVTSPNAVIRTAGTDLKAAGDISIRSAGNIELAGVADIYQSYTKRTKKKWYGSKKTTETWELYETWNTTDLTGRNITISAGNNLSTAGNLNAAGNLVLDAANDLKLGSYTNRVFKDKKVSKSRFWGLTNSSSRSGFDNYDATGASLMAEADMSLVTDLGDIVLEGSKLTAGGQILLDPGSGDLVLTTLIDRSTRWDQKVKDNGVTITTTVQQWYDESADHVRITAPSVMLGSGDRVTLNLAADDQAAADAYINALPPSLRDQVITTNLINTKHTYEYDRTVTLNPAFAALVNVVVSTLAAPFGPFAGAVIRAVVPELIKFALTGEFDLQNTVKQIGAQYFTAQISDWAGGQLEGYYKTLSTDPLLGIGSKLTEQSVISGGVNNLISSGVNSVVYGTDFGANFKAATATSVIALGTADLQNWVGDLGLGEGSLQHALAHGVVGCASAELQDGDCGAGAASAIAASIMSGQAKANGQPLTLEQREQLIANAERVGALVGYVFSGGNATNVGVASGIAGSAVENNYLFHAEEERREELQNLKKQLGCTNDSTDTTCRSVLAELYSLNKLDATRDENLTRACEYRPASIECVRQRALVRDAYHSYLAVDGLIPGDGTLMGKEYFSVQQKYGEVSEAQLSAMARQAVMDIAVDGVISTVQLAEIAARAKNGDPEAQALLWAIGREMKNAVLHPITTVEQDVSSRLAEADRLEAIGDIKAADELRVRVMMDYTVAMTGVGSAGVKLVTWGTKGVLSAGKGRGTDAPEGTGDGPNPGTEPGATDAEAGDPSGFGGTKSDGTFADGGHLIDRHVGKTEQELVDRANGVGQRAPAGGASSYSSLDAADHYTNQVIDANRADIDAYIASGNIAPRAFSIQDTGQSTGRWVPKGGAQSQSVTGSTVVIRPNPNVSRGYDVVTGHPCPTGSCPTR